MNKSLKNTMNLLGFKNHSFIFLLVLASLIYLQACDKTSSTRQIEISEWNKNDGKIKVLATTAMINDTVKKVGGEFVSSVSLIQGELDPHSYQLVKGDDEKLSHADLIFYNGLGLEHGPSLYHYLNENRKAVSLGDLIHQQNPDQIIYVNEQKDPHIWMDIGVWSKTVPFIVSALSEKDPDHADYYSKNGQKLQTEMAEVDAEVKRILHEVPEENRYLVTSHDAFNYFARAYLTENGEIESGEWRKRFTAPEGLAPESQLSTTHIKSIIDYLIQHHIHVLFPETNVSQDSIKKIVQAGREKGLNIYIACCPLYGDAMGPPGSAGDTYLKMIKHNAQMLVKHMKNPGAQHDQVSK